eukprot:6491495-Amphidinium_carterae.4
MSRPYFFCLLAMFYLIPLEHADVQVSTLARAPARGCVRDRAGPHMLAGRHICGFTAGIAAIECSTVPNGGAYICVMKLRTIHMQFADAKYEETTSFDVLSQKP